MKVLITGASGLVGRNLVECFENTSHEILTPSHNEMDLLNRAEVYKYLKDNNPDCVIHLAAKVGSISANVLYPLQYLLENLDMGRNIIIGAYETGIKKFINIGSACVYPVEKHNQLLTEDMAVTGSFEKENEGYSISKAACVLMCRYIANKNPNYFYKTLIPCNVYGRGCVASFTEQKSHMIEAAIKKIYRAKKENLSEVQIWGDGKAKREFIYAGDLAKIILYAAENIEKIPGILNVGSGIEYSVDECYKAIAESLNYTGKFFHDLTQPSGTNRRLLDVSALNNLGMKAETNLSVGIQQTVDYYENFVLKELR